CVLHSAARPSPPIRTSCSANDSVGAGRSIRTTGPPIIPCCTARKTVVEYSGSAAVPRLTFCSTQCRFFVLTYARFYSAVKAAFKNLYLDNSQQYCHS